MSFPDALEEERLPRRQGGRPRCPAAEAGRARFLHRVQFSSVGKIERRPEKIFLNFSPDTLHILKWPRCNFEFVAVGV